MISVGESWEGSNDEASVEGLNWSVWAARRLKVGDVTFSVYPGNRKFVMPTFSEKEGLLGYGRLFDPGDAEECWENERRLLRKLQTYEFKTGLVPKILLETTFGRRFLLFIGGPKNLEGFNGVTSHHIDWLVELYKTTGRKMRFSESFYAGILESQVRDILTFLGETGSGWLRGLVAALKEELSDQKLHFAISQREFPYYHALKIRGENRIFVVDWELGSENYPPYFDLFHCLLSGLPERKRTGLRNSFLERAVALFEGRGSAGEMVLRYGRNIDVPADMGYLLFPLYLLDQISIFLKWERTPERSGLKERLEALRTIATEKAFVRAHWMGGSCEL